MQKDLEMGAIARRTPTRRLFDGLSAIALAGLLTACGPRGAPIEPGVGPDGFPVGTFTKDLFDPELGNVRLAWTFALDGRWTEVPFAIDGQTLPAPAVRGSYTVDGGTLAMATNYPLEWAGTSRHTWRLDGELLWTRFVSSDISGDADWFAMLDVSPWTPSP